MSEVNTITPEEAGKMVKNYRGGRFFSVTFTKRTDGRTRVMNCRKGVSKDVKGEGHRYNVEEKGLVCVRDVQKQGFRMIPLESIRRIKMEGKEYQVAP